MINKAADSPLGNGKGGVRMSEIDVIKSELDALERAAIDPNLSLKDLLDIKKRIRRLRRKLNLISKKEGNK